ncbi:hypothetical protein BSK59_16045 [Paenibacillus odorifer]|uniref:hypothetical protein n=1 Tax=Paenibacillus odorifer TaxID=189426 RepID=UPI00096F69E5|nr:hypothetical protein [Paenibacillus odorifer]OME54091.1 hypothetical protein BSK59_16045 [Paenibacillus odorifer]
MNNTTKELNTIKELVLHILKTNPETRSNDTLLYLECCKYLGATSLEDLSDLNLSIISVHKMRQSIQNKDKMFMPNEEALQNRKRRGYEIRQYMRKTS